MEYLMCVHCSYTAPTLEGAVRRARRLADGIPHRAAAGVRLCGSGGRMGKEGCLTPIYEILADVHIHAILCAAWVLFWCLAWFALLLLWAWLSVLLGSPEVPLAGTMSPHSTFLSGGP